MSHICLVAAWNSAGAEEFKFLAYHDFMSAPKMLEQSVDRRQDEDFKKIYAKIFPRSGLALRSIFLLSNAQ